MLQTVSSLEPLEEVSYYPRGDGLADIRIRRNITTVMHAKPHGRNTPPTKPTRSAT